jgi:hypothetical protein
LSEQFINFLKTKTRNIITKQRRLLDQQFPHLSMMFDDEFEVLIHYDVKFLVMPLLHKMISVMKMPELILCISSTPLLHLKIKFA